MPACCRWITHHTLPGSATLPSSSAEEVSSRPPRVAQILKPHPTPSSPCPGPSLLKPHLQEWPRPQTLPPRAPPPRFQDGQQGPSPDPRLQEWPRPKPYLQEWPPPRFQGGQQGLHARPLHGARRHAEVTQLSKAARCSPDTASPTTTTQEQACQLMSPRLAKRAAKKRQVGEVTGGRQGLQA